MEAQTFESVFDALADTPAEAANLKVRAELLAEIGLAGGQFLRRRQPSGSGSRAPDSMIFFVASSGSSRWMHSLTSLLWPGWSWSSRCDKLPSSSGAIEKLAARSAFLLQLHALSMRIRSHSHAPEAR
jgi:hypothetical protein